MSGVVVGFDGSTGAEEALRFALTEARLRGSVLRVVCAWHTPVAAYSGLAYVPTYDLSEMAEQAAHEMLKKAVELLGDSPGVTIETEAVEGQPADVLVEQGAGADLLVVGSRGHGGFTSLLLGSISQQVAHHATCPVGIVPDPRHQHRHSH